MVGSGEKKQPTSPPMSKRASGVQPRKRRHSRVEMAAPPLVRIQVRGEEEVVEGYCDNLSVGGMFISCLRRLPQGTRVHLTLCVPGNAIGLSGTVQWTTHKGMGIQHDLLGARATFLLTEYLSSLDS